MIERTVPLIPEAPFDDPSPDVVDAVARYDEELRRGSAFPSTAVDSPGIETPDIQRSLQGCLDILERAWPRQGDTAQPAQPQRIGKFEIERVLGQGGFGIVYLARDTSLGRTVALKVPRLHTLTSRSLLERFQREARAAAALDHPHIVPLLEAGDDNGLCYIASAYCPGPNLAQWLRDRPNGVAPALAAQIVASLADAVAYSHSRGIMHRDIKPGNIMLVPRNEHEPNPTAPMADDETFSPRLGDFGLAKVIQEVALSDESIAETSVLGTPAYMAPEQMETTSDIVGPGEDVYSLGVVLYELLVGRPPFQGTSVLDVLDQVRANDPVPVRRLRRDVPRNLETICLHCLTKSPAGRYSTAAALRDDLQRCVEGRPILAKPPGPAGLAVRWVRRRPAVAALIAAAVLFVTVASTLQTWHAARLQTSNEELQAALVQISDEKSRTVANEREARGIAYALDVHNAWRAREEGDFSEFSRIVDRYRDGTPLAQYRGAEWHYLERFTRMEERTLLELPTATYDIVYGPDGLAAVVGEDADVRLLDVKSGVITDSWPTGQVEVNSACFMPDGDSLWTAGDDGTIRRWDLATFEELQRIDAHAGAKVFKVICSAGLDLLITCGTDGPIRLWDLANGCAPAGILEGHTDWVQDIVLVSGGRQLVSASDDFSVRLWDLETRREIRQHEFDDAKMRDLALSPDGRHLAICCQRLVIYDLQSQASSLELPILDETRLALFSNDGQRLYVADRMGVVNAFDLTFAPDGRILSADPFFAWHAHEGGVYALRSSPDGRSIVTSGRDGRVSQWDAIGNAQSPRIFSHPDTPQTLAFHPQGRWLVIGGDRCLSVYDFRLPQHAPIVLDAEENWTVAAVSPQGTMIAAGTVDGRVRVFSVEGDEFRPLASFRCLSEEEVQPFSFSHDGNALAVANRDRYVQVFDPRTGIEVARKDVGRMACARLSPVENLLAVSQVNQSVLLWDWASDTTVWESAAFKQRPQWIVFSPDGRQILVNSDERTVRILDRATGQVIGELGQHRAALGRLAMSPDGRTVVTKDIDGWINLWHAESGQRLFSLRDEYLHGYDEIAYSPDGSWLAYRANSREVHLLPMHP